MRLLLFITLFWLQSITYNHAQTYQDTTFTEPLVILFAPDTVTLINCHFKPVNGVGMYVEGSKVVVSGCTFDDINAVSIYAAESELYLVSDTFTNVNGGVSVERGSLNIMDCLFLNNRFVSITSGGSDVVNISNCTIYDAGKGILISGIKDVTEVVLANNSIKKIGFQPGNIEFGNGISVNHVRSLRIENSLIDSCRASGINLWGIIDGPVEVKHNHISRTFEFGIVGGTEVNNGNIEGNEVSYTGYLDNNAIPREGAISWNGRNSRIVGNHISHAIKSESNCIRCGSGIVITRPALIAKNLIHDCEGYGIVYGSGNPAEGEDLLITNNIVYDVQTGAFLYENYIELMQPYKIEVKNNTFHSIGTINIAIDYCSRPFFLDGNILIVEGNADTSLYVKIDDLFMDLVTQQFNLKGPGDFGFVNFGARNFHLADENSPAYRLLPHNFGLPNDDFDAEPRLGRHDAGADELNLENTICGCNNCPDTIADIFSSHFTYSVVTAANNNLGSNTQGVCGIHVVFEHQNLSDLSMELVSPAGQKVKLISPNGVSGSTIDTKWDIGFTTCLQPASPDPGFSAIWNSGQLWGQSGLFTGIYYPATGCLENFNQGTVTGDWTLLVADNQPNTIGSVLGFEVIFCDETGIGCFSCTKPPVASITINHVGSWGIALQNTTTGAAASYEIDFGDGQSMLSLPAFYEYQAPGNYMIKLVAINECGRDTTLVPVQIFGAPPAASVFTSPEDGCIPLTIQVQVIQEDHVNSWHWYFPGGNPSESFEKEPTVTYSNLGNYVINLEMTNSVGTTVNPEILTLTLTDSVPVPSFAVEVLSSGIQVTNTTQGASSFYWSLNGGSPVGLNSSPYFFSLDSSGLYQVSLSATNICGEGITNVPVSAVILGVDPFGLPDWKIQALPNPTTGTVQLLVDFLFGSDANILIVNSLGQVVKSWPVFVQKGPNNFTVDLKDQPSGGYQIKLLTEKGMVSVRVIKQ